MIKTILKYFCGGKEVSPTTIEKRATLIEALNELEDPIFVLTPEMEEHIVSSDEFMGNDDHAVRCDHLGAFDMEPQIVAFGKVYRHDHHGYYDSAIYVSYRHGCDGSAIYITHLIDED